MKGNDLMLKIVRKVQAGDPGHPYHTTAEWRADVAAGTEYYGYADLIVAIILARQRNYGLPAEIAKLCARRQAYKQTREPINYAGMEIQSSYDQPTILAHAMVRHFEELDAFWLQANVIDESLSWRAPDISLMRGTPPAQLKPYRRLVYQWDGWNLPDYEFLKESDHGRARSVRQDSPH